MKNIYDYNQNFDYEVSGIDLFCRDSYTNMESNWSDDYSWDKQEVVETYMSRRNFRVESLLFAY